MGAYQGNFSLMCVLFLCKSGCSANEPAAQAGRGALLAIGNFTECKVLKGNAAPLHSGAAGSHEGGKAGAPDFIGRKTGKRGFRWVFKNALDQFQRGNARVRR